MPVPATLIVVEIAGRVHRAWSAIKISRKIDDAVATLELAIPRPGGDGRWGLIDLDSPVRVRVGGDLLFTGRIEQMSVNRSVDRATMSWKGRSLGGDMADSAATHPTKEWRSVSGRQILGDLARPFDLDFQIADVPDLDAPRDFRLNHGEGALDACWRLLSLSGAQIRDRPDGGFLVEKGDGGTLGTTLRDGPGGVILDYSYEADATQRHSSVEAHAQRPAPQAGAGGGGHRMVGVGADPTTKRHRPLIIDVGSAASKSEVEARAQTEIARRIARQIKIGITAQGWRDGAGRLWVPGARHQIVISDLGLDRQMLLSEVSYEQDHKGTRSVLSLVPPEAAKPAARAPATATAHAPGAGSPAAGMIPVGGVAANDWRPARPRPSYDLPEIETTTDGRKPGPV